MCAVCTTVAITAVVATHLGFIRRFFSRNLWRVPRILLFVVAMLCVSCNNVNYEFAKRECLARNSKLKSYEEYHMDGRLFTCEDGFRYDE